METEPMLTFCGDGRRLVARCLGPIEAEVPARGSRTFSFVPPVDAIFREFVFLRVSGTDAIVSGLRDFSEIVEAGEEFALAISMENLTVPSVKVHDEEQLVDAPSGDAAVPISVFQTHARSILSTRMIVAGGFLNMMIFNRRDQGRRVRLVLVVLVPDREEKKK